MIKNYNNLVKPIQDSATETVVYSPQGKYLTIRMTAGGLRFLDPVNNQEQTEIQIFTKEGTKNSQDVMKNTKDIALIQAIDFEVLNKSGQKVEFNILPKSGDTAISTRQYPMTPEALKQFKDLFFGSSLIEIRKQNVTLYKNDLKSLDNNNLVDFVHAGISDVDFNLKMFDVVPTDVAFVLGATASGSDGYVFEQKIKEGTEFYLKVKLIGWTRVANK